MPPDDTRPGELRATPSIGMSATGRQERRGTCVADNARLANHRLLPRDTQRRRVLQFVGAA